MLRTDRRAVPTRVGAPVSHAPGVRSEHTQVCIDGDDPVKGLRISAASSLSMVPGWCQITILRRRSMGSSISVPGTLRDDEVSEVVGSAIRNLLGAGKCRESSIRLMIGLQIRSLQAYTLVYCQVILTIRFFLVVILKTEPTSSIPVK